jgi:S1 RNA binding domain protein
VVEEAPEPESLVGQIIEGNVTGITSFGAFVKLPTGQEGLVHISEIANEYVTDITQFVGVGETVKVKVLGLNKQKKYDLSIKQIAAPSASSGSPFRGRKDAPGGGGFAGKPKEAPKKAPDRVSFNLIGRYRRPRDEMSPFDSKINSFLKVSEEKLIDLKRNIQGKQGVVKRKRKKKA